MTEFQTLAARIDGLEMRIAHQDHTIEELSATIADQWKRIEELTGQIARLDDQVREIENSDGFTGETEPPPPHY
jgi:SlyX protein